MRQPLLPPGADSVGTERGPLPAVPTSPRIIPVDRNALEDKGLEVSGMKATAGTARSGREAAALRQAAAHRVVAKAPAKAAKTTTARKAAPATKHVRPTRGKSIAQPAKKAPPPKKPNLAKQSPSKHAAKKPVAVKQIAVKPTAAKPVVTKPVAAKPVAPKATAPKPVASKAISEKTVAAKPAVTQTVPAATVKPPPARVPAAPLQTVQPKPPATPATPAPVPAAPPVSVSASAAPAAAADRRPMMPDRPPARPMAKAEIFVEGDHVVYPTHGVGKVERIATEEIAGHKLELIHITFEENRMTLRVPVAKARTAGLRKLATRKLFDEALAVLKGRARIKRTMWSRRAQEYEAKINSGDPLSIAEVVRDLHRNAGQPDQSFSERQIYEAAMDRLAAELAALDNTDKLTAVGKLANFLKTV